MKVSLVTLRMASCRWRYFDCLVQRSSLLFSPLPAISLDITLSMNLDISQVIANPEVGVEGMTFDVFMVEMFIPLTCVRAVLYLQANVQHLAVGLICNVSDSTLWLLRHHFQAFGFAEIGFLRVCSGNASSCI